MPRLLSRTSKSKTGYATTLGLLGLGIWNSGQIYVFTLMGVMDSNRLFYFYCGLWIALNILYLAYQRVAPFTHKWVASMILILVSDGSIRWIEWKWSIGGRA